MFECFQAERRIVECPHLVGLRVAMTVESWDFGVPPNVYYGETIDGWSNLDGTNEKVTVCWDDGDEQHVSVDDITFLSVEGEDDDEEDDEEEEEEGYHGRFYAPFQSLFS